MINTLSFEKITLLGDRKFRLFRQRGGKLLKDFTMLTRRTVVY